MALEFDFDEIYQREFLTIDIDRAFAQMHLYAGREALDEFDLASQLLQVQASATMHHLEQRWTSKKINTDLEKPLIISTFSSGRVLVGDASTSPQQLRKFQFVLGSRAGSRTKGLKVNPQADSESEYDQARWIRENQRAIGAALSKGADIVCLGEFDFPAINDSAPELVEKSNAANERHRIWIQQRLLRHGRPAIVFAGSSHQWLEEGCANVGEIFISDFNENGELAVRHLGYEKQFAAKKLGETLVETREPVHPYFATSFGKVAVLICLDAFDPAMVMSIFAHSRSYNRLDIILVPSYNRSERLLRSCQQLSSLANCIVVYVNALDTARHDKAQVYVSGVSLETWFAQLKDIARMVKSKTRLDRRMVESIPGVRNLRRLIHLAAIGRDIKIESIGTGNQLKSWIIPLGFAAEAARVMTAKHPSNRGRIIASLAVDDE